MNFLLKLRSRLKKGFMAKLRDKAQKTLDEDKARRAAEEKSSKKNKKK